MSIQKSFRALATLSTCTSGHAANIHADAPLARALPIESPIESASRRLGRACAPKDIDSHQKKYISAESVLACAAIAATMIAASELTIRGAIPMKRCCRKVEGGSCCTNPATSCPN